MDINLGPEMTADANIQQLLLSVAPQIRENLGRQDIGPLTAISYRKELQTKNRMVVPAPPQIQEDLVKGVLGKLNRMSLKIKSYIGTRWVLKVKIGNKYFFIEVCIPLGDLEDCQFIRLQEIALTDINGLQ